MKIAFINSCLGGDFSALDIAITLLATYINERTEHDAVIIDLVFHRHFWRRYLYDELQYHAPDVVGISSNTMYMQYVKAIMREVKKNFDVPIILGGHHASIYPEETLHIPECDAICIGDGEEALTYYLDTCSARGGYIRGAGIWYKSGTDIIKNSGGAFRKNIDDLPVPNWDLWKDLDKYLYHLGMLYIIGSRGCPFKCTFCDAHGISDAVDGDYFRSRDPIAYVHEIAQQWKKYKHRNLRLVQLFDPVFTMHADWVEKFCNEYRRIGLHHHVRFSVFSRLDHLDKERIDMLARSGCGVVRVGIESGDAYIRNEVYQKNFSNTTIREVFDLLRRSGIATTTYYMLGGPGETRKTAQTTIDFALELNGSRSVFFVYKPFTQEGIRQVYEYGGVIDQKRWVDADNITFGAVVATKDLTVFQVEWFQCKAYFLTFARRWLTILKRQKWHYIPWLCTYILRGMRNGLSILYLLVYFHVYGYDNVDK